jgi:hypothetical protein
VRTLLEAGADAKGIWLANGRLSSLMFRVTLLRAFDIVSLVIDHGAVTDALYDL